MGKYIQWKIVIESVKAGYNYIGQNKSFIRGREGH